MGLVVFERWRSLREYEVLIIEPFGCVLAE